MSRRILVSVAVGAALVTLVACNDYGGGNGVTNYPPVASIVADPTSVPLGDDHTTVVTLDASASTDPDGDPLSFSWTVPDAQFVDGTTEHDAVIRVTFPGATPETVTLAVSDGGGGTDTKQVTIGVL